MNTHTLRTHFIALVMAGLSTFLMFGGIDRLATQPELGSVLAHAPAPAETPDRLS